MSKLIFSLISPLNVSLTFVALMFFLPFVIMIHNLPIPSFYSEWIAGLLGLLAIGSLLSSKSLPHIRLPQISIVFLGLSAIVIVQWLMGLLHSTPFALLVISYLIWAFLLTILGNHLRKELGWEKVVTPLAIFLVIAGFVNAGVVVLQIVVHTGGEISFLPYLSSFGTLSQPNHFSSFCALAIASTIYLYIKGKFSTSFLLLILTWFLMMLAFSGSKSSWIYLTALLTLAFITQVLTIRQNKVSTETRGLLQISILVLPLFSLVLLFINYITPDGIVNLPTERFIANANLPSHRLLIWVDSLHLFLQSPWLGIGIGNMRLESFLLQDTPTTFASNSIHENAHNLFLHLLTEMGVGALLIVIAGLTLWIRGFKWRELNLESWWLITLLAILGIHSMLEYPLWYAYFLGIAAVLLGAGDEKIITFTSSEKPVSNSNYKYALVIRTILVIFLSLGIVNLYSLFLANLKLENAVYRSTNIQSKKPDNDLEWVYRYSLLSPYAEVMFALSTVIDHENIDSKIALNQSAMRFRPLSKLSYQHALLLKLKGNHDEAIKLLDRSLNIYPANFKYTLEELSPQYKKHFMEMLTEVSPTISSTATLNHLNTPAPEDKILSIAK